jgi:hypothetical protein
MGKKTKHIEINLFITHAWRFSLKSATGQVLECGGPAPLFKPAISKSAASKTRFEKRRRAGTPKAYKLFDNENETLLNTSDTCWAEDHE